MAVHGSIGEYSDSIEDWTAYTERLENYFTANDVEDGSKKRAILLNVCGAATYKLIRSLAAPEKLTDYSYEALKQMVKTHHNPKPSVIVQRFKFNTRVRQGGESIAKFVAELRQLSEFCDFGETLSDMLRDRLVCGIGDTRIQRRLLAEPELTFQKALTLSQAMELADRHTKDLQVASTVNPAQIHKLHKKASSSPKSSKDTAAVCYRCGGKHLANHCPFKEAECHACGKKGHIAKVCKSKKAGSSLGQRGNKSSKAALKVQDSVDVADTLEYTLFPVSDQQAKPVLMTVWVDGKELCMEVDTGASVSLVSEATVEKLWGKERLSQLQSSKVKLRTYTGQNISVIGSTMVKVQSGGQVEHLPLLVVGGKGPSLLGRDWLFKLRLDWTTIFNFQMQQGVQEILDRHAEVFQSGLGLVEEMEVKLVVEPEVPARFCKARVVPYALRRKVEAELERLEKEEIIAPVQFSDWATPIVPVLKDDGTVRICGDYRLTVNSALKTEVYPLPRIEDLFASLSGGKVFSKLDLSHAYQQLKLDKESQKYCTINTSKGLYQFKRLPFGIASAPAIFQRTMENLLQGVPQVCVYIDDILVTGSSMEEHLHHLDEVLSRLERAGMRLKDGKCVFLMPEVEYLGHRISSQGLQPLESKVRAISEAPSPKNVAQLQSFLGLVNYYGKFLANSSTVLAPLYKLLKKAEPWKWGKDQEAAFQEIKNALKSSKLLVHFDASKPLVLSCDASSYGVGAVLSHRMSDGTERPIAFSSRTLTPAERKYSQLDKEALAIVFGVKRFHQYLYGRQFVIISDHKPLMHIFNTSKAIPNMASARIQRWAITLSAYTYTINYKSGKEHANADAMSRLPLTDPLPEVPDPPEMVLLMEHLASTPVSAQQIKRLTDRDPVLSEVKKFVLQGWPLRSDTMSEDLLPFIRRKLELSVQDGCLLWGSRVVVPATVRVKVMEELHETHPGISRMKSLARQYVWWPGMDADLECKVKECSACQAAQKSPPCMPLHPWEWPHKPWLRIHADYAGPFQGKMLLILVDAHSKWMDVHITSPATSAVTIEKMRSSFATLGLLEIMVTDNGHRQWLCIYEYGVCTVYAEEWDPACDNGLYKLLRRV